MATKPPNHQKLIVTGKNKKADDYGKDMRQIEQWANEGIVRSLHAGSGITLNPSTGVDTGTGITISSSGGGTTVGLSTLNVGPDSAEFNSQAVFLGPSQATGPGESLWPAFSNSSGGTIIYTFANSWIVAVLGGESICYLPILTVPTYTGGPVSALLSMQTWSIAETNVAIYQTGSIIFASGSTAQPPSSSYTMIVNGGGDITLVAGSGQTGNGLVSTAGGFYIASGQCQFSVPTGTTFT